MRSSYVRGNKPINTSYSGLRPDLLKYISGNKLKVLDVGCATGANGNYLITQGLASEVHGIEISKDMAEIAKQAYSRVYTGSLDNIDLKKTLNNEEYDVILIGDVLEHLIDPWHILSQLTLHLKESGTIVVSLPNIQHIDVFIHVFLKGNWPRNERGIFDKTHLRFFTHKTMLELLDHAGLSIIRCERNYRRRDAMKSKFGRLSIERLLKKIFKNLYTYQFIFVCQKQHRRQN